MSDEEHKPETYRDAKTLEPTGCNPPEGLTPETIPHDADLANTYAGDASLDALPCRFGDYELLEEIARGGMGVVFRARQISLDRIVAVKRILAGEFASSEAIQRFTTEAKAAAGLKHPGIISIYEVGQVQRHHYFSMQLIDGGSLQQQLGTGPLDAQDAAGLVEQVAQAMGVAHRHDVIHRDLKPDNILMDADGQPMVTDFGLAKSLHGESGFTATGQVMGTPSYMAPEQAAGQSSRVGPAADIYALGGVLYACLTGRPPFQSAALVDTLRQILEEEPVAPSKLNRSVPAELEAITLKCLAKEPGQRYATADDLAAALRRWLDDTKSAIGSRSTNRPPRSHGRFDGGIRKRLFWPLAVVVLGLLLTAAVWISNTLLRNQVDPYRKMRQEEVERIVDRYERHPATMLDEPTAGREIVPTLIPPDPAAFETIDRLQVYDFCNWKPYDADRLDEPYSPVTVVKRQKLRKLKPVDEIREEARTTGFDVFMTCDSHPDRFQAFAEQAEVQVGGQAMKARQLAIDVSDIGVQQELELVTRSTYWNAFGRDDQRWVGVIVRDRPFKISFLILFPDSHKVTDYQLRIAELDGSGIRPYEGEQLVIEGDGGRYLFWEIVRPVPQHVYRIDWQW